MASSDLSKDSPLTPLALRLCDALETIAEQTPQLSFVSSAMRKQMARSPIPDDEIVTSLLWVQEMIKSIIFGPSPGLAPHLSMPATFDNPEWTDNMDFSESDIAILEELNNGEPDIGHDISHPHTVTGDE
jgi:hypothetical protein